MNISPDFSVDVIPGSVEILTQELWSVVTGNSFGAFMISASI